VANTPPEKRKYLRKSQPWSEDFTAKLFCNVEFRRERLPKVIGPDAEFDWTVEVRKIVLSFQFFGIVKAYNSAVKCDKKEF
jgi:hypothetical protein